MNDCQILRTGVLFKKGSGTGPFGRKNWKPRYFVLTPSRLQYFTFEDGELKGELSLQGCDEGMLEVMPADSMKTGSSASTIWRVAINAPERRLLLAAGTEMEMNDWVDKLVMAFRINSGQPPTQRSSMPARPSSAMGNAVNSNAGIRDFQNFSASRRGSHQRHSIGADMRPSATNGEKEMLHAQRESMKQQKMEEERRQDQEEEKRQEEQLQLEEEERQRQDAEMRRQLAIQQEREQEETARAAAEELQRQEELEKLAQKERELQKQKALEVQRIREEEEAARIQSKQEQEAIQTQQLADELMMQEALKPQRGEDLLELQRRQKREEHARERAEREKAIKLKMQQEQEQDLEFRMSQQVDSHFSMNDGSDDSDDNDPKCLSAPCVSDSNPDIARISASKAPATAPRSSLVGDVKREMIQKQQMEHQRRREAALKLGQQTRDAEFRQQQIEMEKQRAKLEALNMREIPREVEVAPREIEVVRRAPVKKPAPAAAPLSSFEF